MPWRICSSVNGTILSRLADVSFYAIAIENDDDAELGTTVADLHRHMNDWQQPYNFLAYPFTNQTGESKVRVVIVPRDQEYCEAADQRVAGLEFLTGVLIPGVARLNSMDTIQRDRALLQATLKPERQLALERLLRGVYGLPPAGSVVRARVDETDSTVFKAAVETNDKLISSAETSSQETINNCSEALGPSESCFGAIDPSHWSWPLKLSLEGDFKTKRLNANVLVRITRASICQSDRRVLANRKPNELARGWALGHEGGGYVVDPGPWAGEIMAGDKVVVLPHLSCGECEHCHRYMSNLCPWMRHLGFHLNGNLADLMAFPYQCILPVGNDFPDDALPLVEPLACVLRALFRIRHPLRGIADTTRYAHQKNFFTIFGAGPMGCLAALAARRSWDDLNIRMTDPNPTRGEAARSLKCADEVLDRLPPRQQSAISFVAASNFEASVDAIESTEFGGTVMLFSGINTDEQGGGSEYQGKNLEHIHRCERFETHEDAYGDKRVRLIGSSGYILDDVKRSIVELKKYYSTHYIRVQNVEVDGLNSETAIYKEPHAENVHLGRKAVETLLSTRAVDDPNVAGTLKVLIRL